jgi:hypothetical protein
MSDNSDQRTFEKYITSAKWEDVNPYREGHKPTPSESAMMSALWEIQAVERQLSQYARSVTEQVQRAVQYLAAEPGELVYTPQTLGQTVAEYDRNVITLQLKVSHLQTMVYMLTH